MEADPEDGENNILNENPVDMQDVDELIEEVIPAPNNDEGLIIVPEDNIVSEEESFVESDDDNDTELQHTSSEEEVVVADIEDEDLG